MQRKINARALTWGESSETDAAERQNCAGASLALAMLSLTLVNDSDERVRVLNGAPVAGHEEADNIYCYIDEEQQAGEGRGSQESGLALRSEQVVATIHAEDPLGQR